MQNIYFWRLQYRYFFQIFIISRSSGILIVLIFWLRVYPWSILNFLLKKSWIPPPIFSVCQNSTLRVERRKWGNVASVKFVARGRRWSRAVEREITFSRDHLRPSAANFTRVFMTAFASRCVYYFTRWGDGNWRLEWLWLLLACGWWAGRGREARGPGRRTPPPPTATKRTWNVSWTNFVTKWGMIYEDKESNDNWPLNNHFTVGLLSVAAFRYIKMWFVENRFFAPMGNGETWLRIVSSIQKWRQKIGQASNLLRQMLLSTKN